MRIHGKATNFIYMYIYCYRSVALWPLYAMLLFCMEFSFKNKGALHLLVLGFLSDLTDIDNNVHSLYNLKRQELCRCLQESLGIIKMQECNLWLRNLLSYEWRWRNVYNGENIDICVPCSYVIPLSICCRPWQRENPEIEFL